MFFLKRYLVLIQWNIFFKGMFMGIADLVPGISGGTVAFATGIYMPLLENIKKIDVNLIKALIKGDFKYVATQININFLATLFCGILFSILIFSRLVCFCLKNPFLSVSLYSIFFCLVISAIIIIFKKINRWNFINILFAIFGIIIAYLSSCYLDKNLEKQDVEVFYYIDPLLIFSGLLGMCALLLPGLSGSFVLLFLGQYFKVINAVSSLTYKFDIYQFFILLNVFWGMIIGALFFSRIILFIIKKYRSITFSFIAGLMIGSLKSIWPYS